MLNDKEAVFFDLDGTLADSMWVWKQIDIEYLRIFDLKVPAYLHEQIEGMSFTQTAAYFKQNFELPVSIEQIKQTWNQMAYEKYMNEVPLKRGARKLLEELHQKKIRTGIATSNSRELVDAFLHKQELDGLFDSVITSCEVNRNKPEPDIYLESAARLKADPSRCLVFEDITMGILAGKRAGMKVCAVQDDFSEYQEEKKKEYADYFIRDYYDVINNIYEVLKSD